MASELIINYKFDSLNFDVLSSLDTTILYYTKLSYYGIKAILLWHNASSQKTTRELLKQSKTVCSDWQHKVHNEASFHWSSTRFDCWSSPF